ncbi:zinc-dependent alcohol dehydrogenase [Cohnella soli]|uniref:Zinc-binding alcohol dehydrogenase n=1 Tax=Cohnella soli TaxID=425005 RepID=A0ABW0I4I2_9BACL
MKLLVSREGRVAIEDIDEPIIQSNFVLVETLYSAISPGTELILQAKPGAIPLGYSAMGVVRAVGDGVDHVRIGDRVACYGAPYVRHAQKLAVPKHLCVPIGDSVASQEASLVGLGAIAIHALRQADLQFGETVAVIGLGVLGQLIGQIAEAAGYRVGAVDVLSTRCEAMRAGGVESVYESFAELERAMAVGELGLHGFDAVLLCAGGSNPGIIDKAIGWLRDRGKVVVVGDIATTFNRNEMFAKEIQVLISRAGGAGRYDLNYEREGVDYPIGYVRWTEGRNMAEFIRLLANGKLNMSPLIRHELPFDRAEELYELYRHSPGEMLGAVLSYA